MKCGYYVTASWIHSAGTKCRDVWKSSTRVRARLISTRRRVASHSELWPPQYAPALLSAGLPVLKLIFGHSVHCRAVEVHFENLDFWFLPRDAMRKRGLCCRPVSVPPSLRLVYCIQMAEDIVKRFVLSGSPEHSSFLTPSADTQLLGEPLQRERKIQGGGENLWISTEIAVYLGNSTR